MGGVGRVGSGGVGGGQGFFSQPGSGQGITQARSDIVRQVAFITIFNSSPHDCNRYSSTDSKLRGQALRGHATETQVYISPPRTEGEGEDDVALQADMDKPYLPSAR